MYSAGIYLFKVNNKDIRKRCEMFKVNIKNTKRCCGVFIVNFEHILQLFLVCLFLSLNK